MKIIDVCAFYTPHGGGVRTYIERKLKIGAAMGQEIIIIAPGAEDRVEHRPEGGRIIHIASPQLIVDRRYRYFEGAEAVHRILDAERPDVVEASSPWRTGSRRRCRCHVHRSSRKGARCRSRSRTEHRPVFRSDSAPR